MPAAPGRHRDGEAQREVMAHGRRHGNRDTQFEPEHPGVRAIDLDPSAGGLHQGAQPSCCRSDAVYMAATDQMPAPNKALATREPSIHGSRAAPNDMSQTVTTSEGRAFGLSLSDEPRSMPHCSSRSIIARASSSALMPRRAQAGGRHWSRFARASRSPSVVWDRTWQRV